MPVQCQSEIHSVSTTMNTEMTIDISLLVFDPEEKLNTSSLEIISGPLFGSARLLTSSSIALIIYTPPPDFIGTDMFIYSICDIGLPPSCCGLPDSTVAIYISGSTQTTTSTGQPNSGLVCQEEIHVISTTIDIPVEIDILSLVGDPSGNIDLTSFILTSGPLYGTAILHIDENTASLTYTPPPHFVGTDLLVYSICDLGPVVSCCTDPHTTIAIYVSSGTTATTSTATLTTTTSTSGGGSGELSGLECQEEIHALSTAVDTPAEIDILSLVGDPSGRIDVMSLTLTSGPLFGTASLVTNSDNHTATIIYRPPAGFRGTDLIVYSICALGDRLSCCGDPESTIAIYVMDHGGGSASTTSSWPSSTSTTGGYMPTSSTSSSSSGGTSFTCVSPFTCFL